MDQPTIIIVAACLTAAAAVYLLSSSLRLNLGPAPARALADYLGEREEGKGVAPQAVERERVILASLGLPHREGLLTALKVGAGVVPGLVLLVLGFPLVPSVGAGGLVAMLVHAGLEGRWRAFRVGLEGELPTFVSRLASTLLVTGSPLLALEEVTATLADDSPLRAWMERLVAGIRTGGQRHMESARAEAAQISPSLALVIFQLGRFFETGGAGFTRAFATTADELSAILEARAIAGAKAESARSAVHMMLAIMGVILLMLLSSPVQREGFAHPTAQLVTAASLTAMAVGYMVLNGMIEEALD
jgi:hypothetical protein